MALAHGSARRAHQPGGALSNGLAKQGSPPDHLDVTATVPGMDADAFREAAQAAKDGCPVSGALKGNVDLSVDAALSA